MRKWQTARDANQECNGYFEENLKAIEKVLPLTVATKDIYITLGSPWVSADVIDDIMEHFCVGCYNCITDETKCPFYEKKNTIMKEVEKADLLIFTTPTYCMRASAPMKSFMDLTFTYWMVHRSRKSMFSKKAVVISTAAGSGMKAATKDIANTLFYWGVPCVKEYGVAVQAMGWNQVSEKKKECIKKDIQKMAKSLRLRKSSIGKKWVGLTKKDRGSRNM